MYELYKLLTEDEIEALSTLVAQYVDQLVSPLWIGKELVHNESANEYLPFVVVDKIDSSETTMDLIAKNQDQSFKMDGQVFDLLVRAGKRSKPEKIKDNQERVFDPSFGLLLANHMQGGFQLFDSPVEESNVLAIEFKTAYLSVHSDVSRGMYGAFEDKEYMEILLSPSQFVRMMSANQSLIPCTISHTNGVSHDCPKPYFQAHVVLRQELKTELIKLMQPLAVMVKELCDSAQNQSFVSKKAVAAFQQQIQDVEKLYCDLSVQLKESKSEKATGILEQFMKELNVQLSDEIKRLPEHMRQQIALPKLY